MSTIRAAILRELRVAFSRRAQPVWFRVVKWTCILVGAALIHDRRWFWWTLASLAAAGISLHLFYRWKTKSWTRAWGGWNDLEAGRDL
ncbi:MAG: hypothetical protein MUF81_03130 [Verrucomicrobia bacterium]|nr:hypothetical protein [Verrucomicrobiota bacterium]